MKKVIPLDPKKQLITPKKRVAAYARVSIDTDPMMHSVEAQISYYSALIQSNPDWIYAGVYADKGISGTGVKKRRSFQEMMQACEKGEIDIILCKSISRFARNTVDLLESVRRLKELGVDVQFERERISSLSKEGEFMLSVLASFAQEESRSISENCKWGIRKGYASGNPHVNNERIFGYRYDKEQKQYVIVPEEAEIVREIFRLYLDGMSTDKIAKKLNAEGKRTSTGAIFRVSRINVILDYEFYTGDRLLQKHYLDGHLTKKQKKNNGELPQYATATDSSIDHITDINALGTCYITAKRGNDTASTYDNNVNTENDKNFKVKLSIVSGGECAYINYRTLKGLKGGNVKLRVEDELGNIADLVITVNPKVMIKMNGGNEVMDNSTSVARDTNTSFTLTGN